MSATPGFLSQPVRIGPTPSAAPDSPLDLPTLSLGGLARLINIGDAPSSACSATETAIRGTGQTRRDFITGLVLEDMRVDTYQRDRHAQPCAESNLRRCAQWLEPGILRLMNAGTAAPGSMAFADAGYFAEVFAKEPELQTLVQQLYEETSVKGNAAMVNPELQPFIFVPWA